MVLLESMGEHYHSLWATSLSRIWSWAAETKDPNLDALALHATQSPTRRKRTCDMTEESTNLARGKPEKDSTDGRGTPGAAQFEKPLKEENEFPISQIHWLGRGKKRCSNWPESPDTQVDKATGCLMSFLYLSSNSSTTSIIMWILYQGKLLKQDSSALWKLV